MTVEKLIRLLETMPQDSAVFGTVGYDNDWLVKDVINHPGPETAVWVQLLLGKQR